MEINNYIVYIRTNSDGIVTEINSSAFISVTTDWIEIDSGTGDKYHHAQGNYLDKGLLDEHGCYNYKYAGVRIADTHREPMTYGTAHRANND